MAGQGLFISLEGIDGSGKTTLAVYLRQYLEAEGRFLVSIREPGGTNISEKIRQLLLDASNESIQPWTEAILYGAARRQLVEEIIIPVLGRGGTILADRYLDSTLAYQGYGRGLDLTMLQQLNRICTDEVLPGLTLLLDIDPNETRRRRAPDAKDRLEKEGVVFQQRVRHGYLELARKQPERIKIIDASLSVNEVKERAIYLIKEYLQQHVK